MRGLCDEVVQDLTALGERAIEQQLPAGVENIEDKVGERRLPDHFRGHPLPSQPLLQNGKGQCLALTVLVTPGYDLAVENHVLESRKRILQLGKRIGYVIPGTREDPGRALRAMRLRADAVVFILDDYIGKITQ